MASDHFVIRQRDPPGTLLNVLGEDIRFRGRVLIEVEEAWTSWDVPGAWTNGDILNRLAIYQKSEDGRGVFAPHSRVRAAVTPAHRGTGAARQPTDDPASPPTPRHVAMNWARRLKRVFGIEIECCAHCGGKLRILASIEEPEVIARILSHLQSTAPEQYSAELPLGARAPPAQSRLP